MTQTQPIAPSTSKLPMGGFFLIVVTSIIFAGVILGFLSNLVQSFSNSVDNGLVQARHSILVYESSFNKLPGVKGNIAQLNANDVVGFPYRYSEYIKYVGTPSAKNFCLSMDLNAMIPSEKYGLLYIKSSSETIYYTKPAGC